MDEKIQGIVQIHDKYQCEIKLGYQFESNKHQKVYDVATYLFFPNSLGLTPQNYKKQDFYNDIHSYIRLKTPTVLLRRIVNGEDSPLERLCRQIDRLVLQLDSSSKMKFEHQIKMFCCIYKSAIRDHISFLKSRALADDVLEGTRCFLKDQKEISEQFRALRSKLNIPIIPNTVFATFLFADEYISVLSENYAFELLIHLEKSNYSDKESLMKKLDHLIASETKYRSHNNYPSIPEAQSSNEGYIYRVSALKKYMSSILFLTTKLKREGVAFEHLAFAMAAGIAMTFAVFVTLWAQSTYANFSIPLIFALVVGYMFKDRIKEVTKYYIGNQLRFFLFDHKRVIHSHQMDKLGWCKESITSIPENKIPSKVRRIRNRGLITELENGTSGENCYLYRKRIRLFRDRFEKSYHDEHFESINDITRLNVKRYLMKMDNPKKPIYIQKKNGISKVYGKRVYHVVMIMKYTFNKRSSFKRFRIVLNRSGIRRIEEDGSEETPLIVNHEQ